MEGLATREVSRALASVALANAHRWQKAIQISDEVITHTDISVLERASTVDDILKSYNTISPNPITFPTSPRSLAKDQAFCSKWLKYHDKQIDNAYIAYGSAPILNALNTPPTENNTDMLFSDWTPCTVVVDIDPKMQEWYVKNRKRVKPNRFTVTDLRNAIEQL